MNSELRTFSIEYDDRESSRSPRQDHQGNQFTKLMKSEFQNTSPPVTTQANTLSLKYYVDHTSC